MRNDCFARSVIVGLSEAYNYIFSSCQIKILTTSAYPPQLSLHFSQLWDNIAKLPFGGLLCVWVAMRPAPDVRAKRCPYITSFHSFVHQPFAERQVFQRSDRYAYAVSLTSLKPPSFLQRPPTEPSRAFARRVATADCRPTLPWHLLRTPLLGTSSIPGWPLSLEYMRAIIFRCSYAAVCRYARACLGFRNVFT
jgi:hypothetical protein